MFRKTTAVAVLILLVSSLFAGSVTIAPASGQAGTATGGHPSTFGRLTPAVFTGTRGVMSEAYSSRASGAGIARVVVTGGAGITDVAIAGTAGNGAPDAGFIPGGMAGGFAAETGMPQDGADRAGYIMVLTNESSIEITGPPAAQFAFRTNMLDAHRLAAAAGMKLGMMAGLGAASITIHSPVLMFRPGGAAPERFDMKFESRRALTGAPGEIGFFTGHLEMPWGDGSGLAFGAAGISPLAGGAIELNGSMLVDVANLTVAGDPTTAADNYNNAISGGQTNWHSVDLSSAVSSFNVDLKWKDANDSLRLVLYAPDGKVLGPYYDSSDGKTDARINLNIANPSGVAPGEWHLKVTDMATLGNDDYYVKTY